MPALPRWSIAAAVALVFGMAFRPVSADSRYHAAAAVDVGDLEARNSAFLDAVEVFDLDSLLAFFPRTGEFTYMFTLHHQAGDSLSIWRFPAADARRAIEGPLRPSLDQQGHALGMGTFASALAFTHSNWGRVRGSRFVPPGSGASSAVYVEWRREGSRWVVAALGDEGFADETMEPSWIP